MVFESALTFSCPVFSHASSARPSATPPAGWPRLSALVAACDSVRHAASLLGRSIARLARDGVRVGADLFAPGFLARELGQAERDAARRLAEAERARGGL